MSNDPFDGPKATEVRQGDRSVKVTLDDVKKIRIAILEALRSSKLGDRETLIAFTKPLPGWIDSDGHAMAGGWLLEIKNNQLVATYRLSANESRVIGFSASIAKTGEEWKVSQIKPESTTLR